MVLWFGVYAQSYYIKGLGKYHDSYALGYRHHQIILKGITTSLLLKLNGTWIRFSVRLTFNDLVITYPGFYLD